MKSLRPVYLLSTSCISAQHTTGSDELWWQSPNLGNNHLPSVEPDYRELITPRLLRRMGRLVRMSVYNAVKALSPLDGQKPIAIVVGTGMGCLEDTEDFLKEVYGYPDTQASPNSFIQSTHNTPAAQIALFLSSHAYNFTYVHRGFSFETALLDGMMISQEEKGMVLVGACDEITPTYQAVMDRLASLQKTILDEVDKPFDQACKQGEGSAFFVLSHEKTDGAHTMIEGLSFCYRPDSSVSLNSFIRDYLLQKQIDWREIDLVLTGYNGGGEEEIFHHSIRSLFPSHPIAVFKHLSGEYKTAGAFAFWLADDLIRRQEVPAVLMATAHHPQKLDRILILNHYNGRNFIISSLRHADL